MKPTFNNKPKRREPMTANDVAYNKRMSPEVQEEWVEACLSRGKLTTWETEFVENVENQLDRGGTLTERQVEVLERIYNEKV